MSDPERIYVEPEEQAVSPEGRGWSDQDIGSWTGEPWTEYVRADLYAEQEAERDRYREFVEWIFVATADGTLNLDTPAILDGLQCRSAEVLGEERAEELFSALNREE